MLAMNCNCPTALVGSAVAAEAVASVVAMRPDATPVITCWLGGVEAESGRAVLARKSVPTYETPEGAVGAFMHLVRQREVQTMLMQTPSVAAASSNGGARRLVEAVLADRRTSLSRIEVLNLLKASGVPTIDVRVAATPD